MDDLRVTIADVRKLGYCVSGQRRFAEQHGIDFKDFIRNGIPASTLLATDDDMARRAVMEARRRTQDGR